MSQMRFEKINVFVHNSNRETGDSKSLFFNTLEPLMNYVRDQCKECWDPGFIVSVDDMMIIR